MKLDVTEILKKEMSRTEFLGLVGAGVLSMVGVTSMLKNLGGFFSGTSSKTGSLDYGMSNYGGLGKATGNSLKINTK